jgi:arginyl-tRNA--protein-N-Asp/Glu arginylyltransferase
VGRAAFVHRTEKYVLGYYILLSATLKYKKEYERGDALTD